MPRLSESRPDLVQALLARASRPGQLVDADPFSQVVYQWVQWVAPAKPTAIFAALCDEGWTDPANLSAADPAEVVATIRDRKGKVSPRDVVGLIGLARWFVELESSPTTLADLSTDAIRERWRAIKGLSLPTVDALLSRGLGRVAYPVDRGSYRIFARHGWLDTTAEYDEARAALESLAPDESETLVELSDELPRIARAHCKAPAPRCDGCPLKPWLPASGPLGDE